jgi:hypothetical protein
MFCVCSVVGARLVRISDLAFVDEDRRLRFAHDELRAHFDLILVPGEPPHDRVPAVVEPLDDVNEFAAQLVDQTHAGDG